MKTVSLSELFAAMHDEHGQPVNAQSELYQALAAEQEHFPVLMDEQQTAHEDSLLSRLGL